MSVKALCEVGVHIKHRQAAVYHPGGLDHQPRLIACWHAIMHVHLGQHLHALQQDQLSAEKLEPEVSKEKK